MNGENVLDYIDNIDKADQDMNRMNSYKMSDPYINRVVNDYGTKKKEECMRNMVTNIYRDALPENDEIRDRSSEDMNAFIDSQCPNGLYQYITDSRNCALKEAAKECSDSVDSACATMRKTLKESVEETNMPITESDIEYAKDNADSDVKQDMGYIARRGNFSELSEAINSNVADAVKSSVEGAKEAKRANNEFEKNLKNDLSVTTQEAVESKLALKNNAARKDYNLFEAIFSAKSDAVMHESTEDVAGYYYEDLNAGERTMLEAVAEYTKHSVWKALRLKNYDLSATKDLIRDYLAM